VLEGWFCHCLASCSRPGLKSSSWKQRLQLLVPGAAAAGVTIWETALNATSLLIFDSSRAYQIGLPDSRQWEVQVLAVGLAAVISSRQIHSEFCFPACNASFL